MRKESLISHSHTDIGWKAESSHFNTKFNMTVSCILGRHIILKTHHQLKNGVYQEAAAPVVRAWPSESHWKWKSNGAEFILQCRELCSSHASPDMTRGVSIRYMELLGDLLIWVSAFMLCCADEIACDAWDFAFWCLHLLWGCVCWTRYHFV